MSDIGKEPYIDLAGGRIRCRRCQAMSTRSGDIVEVDGIKVAGAKASVMAARMKKRPGESLVLRLLRTNGETYTATLSAVPQTP